MKVSPGEKIFYILNTIFLLITAFLCLAPMLHILAISLSHSAAVTAGRVSFWPVEFTFTSYEYIIKNQIFWRSMLNSVLRVIFGVSVNLICSCLVAFPLSREASAFKFRTIYAWFFFTPMILNGGLIPTYMVIMQTKLLGTFWSLIIPGAVPVFYILVLLNFFRGIPKELEDATLMDGGNHWHMLVMVFLPLSTPALATIAVFAILGHWNSWFDGLIYLNKVNQFPLLSYLQSAVISYDPNKLSDSELIKLAQLGNRSFKAAQIFVAALPVILCYPFLQKYFTKGLIIGSVKG
jgi:putative aldouronate transport system permease protein